MKKYESYKAKFPTEADQMVRIQRRQLPEGWEKSYSDFPHRRKGQSRPRCFRENYQRRRQGHPLAYRRLQPTSPPSTKTRLTFRRKPAILVSTCAAWSPPAVGTAAKVETTTVSYAGRNLHYGVR